MSEDKNERAREQAQLQYESISEMLEALDMDWDRLEELRSDLDELLTLRKEDLRLRQQACQEGASRSAHDALAAFEVENGDRLRELEDQYSDEAEELAELEKTAGDYDDREAVDDAIREDPLDIQVRSGWQSPGETLNADEFQILLCTGGPAVRIVGELDEHGEPYRAWLEYQDWFTTWERWGRADSDTLVRYASHFTFGF